MREPSRFNRMVASKETPCQYPKTIKNVKLSVRQKYLHGEVISATSSAPLQTIKRTFSLVILLRKVSPPPE